MTSPFCEVLPASPTAWYGPSEMMEHITYLIPKLFHLMNTKIFTKSFIHMNLNTWNKTIQNIIILVSG